MNFIPGLLRADLLKSRHTPFLLIHLLAPLVGVSVFLAYYSYSPWSVNDKVLAFMQSLGCAFPILIGLVCSMAVEQEANAGHFQGMLALPASKIAAFTSKLLLLLMFGFAAVMLAYSLFGLGFGRILHQDRMGMAFYLAGAVILFGSNIFLYLLHLAISLRFGRGASIGVGIAGSLVAALMLTGLGDAIWPYIPFAWGVRFISLWTIHASDISLSDAVSGLNAGIRVCIPGTIILLFLCTTWFQRWEGRSTDI
ncbi:lantibiotic immunity ABC transporter MutG family permease subunit [Paenibacillus sp. JNUCC31]|uniref:lantibiotic immunity ABC transporter MutG family permease subunit n=1 Tax=Paenibacillus sp. JNUCC-31 TaxID=2777983 RepID=UPI001780213F|nr:lantibiotic immunity ABC transporter MutG family permease subunit [Paenibacillus sp. JNUCC-31]QOS81897.1 lantibiotic immunity ABC transporter MutG family permease subunit [Paenibacillus sp. JNUCC-31]